MRAVIEIARNDLRLLIRDRGALLFQILVPIIVITIIAATLGANEGGVSRLPVVDEDGGPVARVLIEALETNVEVVEVDRATATDMVGKDSAAAAALILPGGLSKNYLSSRASTITLITDPAKGLEVGTIKAWLLVADRDAARRADPFFEELLVLEESNATGSRLTIPVYEQNVPGFSLMFVLMGVYFGVALGLWDEREWGTLVRLRVAPVSRISIFGGKLLSRFIAGMGQLLLLFGFGHVVFGMSLGHSLPAFILLAACIVYSLTGLSLLVAAFARTREQIIPLGLTVVMVVCSVGGCWWSLYREPVWLQQLGFAFPTAWAMEAIHDLILREKSLSDIAPALGVLIAYGTATLLLGTRFYRLSDRSN